MDTAGLAKAMDLSYQAVQKWINGSTKELTAPNNTKAARVLGVNSDWLATGEGPMERNAPAAPAAEPGMVKLSEREAQLLQDLAVLGASKASRYIDQIALDAADAREVIAQHAARQGVTMAAHSGASAKSRLEIRVGDGNPNQRPLPLSTVRDPFTAQPDEREEELYRRIGTFSRDEKT